MTTPIYNVTVFNRPENRTTTFLNQTWEAMLLRKNDPRYDILYIEKLPMTQESLTESVLATYQGGPIDG
jgi:hypothetical protein